MAEEEALRLDDFRPPYESDDQWNLRKKFLERHWGKYSKNRLICLSQIFINMEFFGCKYNDIVCEEVAELAGDLAAERREERAQVIQKTFVKATDPDEPAQKRGRYGNSGNRHSIDASGTAIKSPFAPSKPKRLGEDLPEGSRPARLLAKDKLLVLLKAQLTVAPDKIKTGLDKLNLICNRAKVSWQFKVAEGMGYLSVADVLVVKQRVTEELQGKESCCQSACERLLSVSLECREEEALGGALKLALYTSADKRVGWEGPEAALFAAPAATLVAARDSIAELKDGIQVDPRDVLETAATFAKTELSVKDKQLAGWKRQKIVSMGGVELDRYEVSGKEKPEVETKRFADIAHNILRPYHRIYEDDDGRMRLLAKDEPISDDVLRKALAKDQKS